MDLGAELVSAIPLGFLLDLEEKIRAAGREAKERTRDANLGSRSRPRIVGQLRTGIIEQALVDVAKSSGCTSSEFGSVAGTEVYLHQAHAKLGPAVIVRASIAEPGTLPSANKSRKRLLEKLNRHVDASYDMFNPVPMDELGNRPTAVFVLICPNRQSEDGIGEIALAVADSRHQDLRFYETLEEFKGRYAPPAAPPVESPPLRRRNVQPFRPPETGENGDAAAGNEE